MNYVVVILAVFLMCGCASVDYGDVFKDAVLPILVAEGAPKAKEYVVKMVKDGKLTQEQADKILDIIDQLSKRRIEQ